MRRRPRAHRHPPSRRGSHFARQRGTSRRAFGRHHPARLERKEKPPSTKSHTRFFLTSLRADEKSRSTQAARGHWSIENRNHHKRDASAWQEDRHRHRRPNAALNLALTRNALLAIIPFAQGKPLSSFFALYHRRPTAAIHLILLSRPAL